MEIPKLSVDRFEKLKLPLTSMIASTFKISIDSVELSLKPSQNQINANNANNYLIVTTIKTTKENHDTIFERMKDIKRFTKDLHYTIKESHNTYLKEIYYIKIRVSTRKENGNIVGMYSCTFMMYLWFASYISKYLKKIIHKIL